jgi:hypothetical protein
MRRAGRLLVVVVAALLVAALAGCGGDGRDRNASPGTEANPLQARQPTGGSSGPGDHASFEGPAGGTATKAAAQAVIAPPHRGRSGRTAPAGSSPAAGRKAASPRLQRQLAPSASRPCSLVTKAQARTILGLPVLAPIEAPQGPTCIYQSRSRERFITLSVQGVEFGQIRRKLGDGRRIPVGDRTGYCGTFGGKMLYVPLGRGRVLSVAAPCKLASEFAARALPRL